MIRRGKRHPEARRRK